MLFLLALILLFIYWWDKNITKQYRDKLRTLELESLRQELDEKNDTIQKLMVNNDAQARLIHKDNKLIPAMLTAVTDYLETTDTALPDSAREYGKGLSEQLKELSRERVGILSLSAQSGSTLPLTNHAGIDAMLSYMKKRADTEKILFEVKLHPNFPDKIGDVIAEADLSHLLSDLIENAMIATRNAERKEILVHLGILYDVPTVEVSDSGAPFDPAVYQDLGLLKHSTHLDNGGSGIGLMDIWELKKEYAASLHIYEYASKTSPFTKMISLVFDRKKHYLIQSYRPEELVQMQTRSDLYILPL
jgi:signal transduction histidine kinase